MAGSKAADRHTGRTGGPKLLRMAGAGKKANPSNGPDRGIRTGKAASSEIEAGLEVSPQQVPRSLPLKMIGFGMIAVAVICSWQFVILSRNLDIPGNMHLTSVGSLLGVHEANISALARQQRRLTSLVLRLSEETLKEHEELLSLRAKLNASSAEASTQGSNQGEKPSLRGQQPDNIADLRSMIDTLKIQAAASSLPRGDSKGGFPDEWLQRFSQSELEASAKEAKKWQEGTKNAFLHVWKNYRRLAWGKDEMRPVSGVEGRRWGNIGLMILDSLSTMWVMGLTKEFDEAEEWVAKSLSFENTGYVSFFETTIRALGGLCSAHSLSGRPVFLQKAVELAERMLPAFSPNAPGFPASQVDIGKRTGRGGWFGGAVLAEVGTVQLEFRYVSQQTHNPAFGEKADRAMRNIVKAAGRKGIIPWGLSRTSPVRFINRHVTMGAMGDSYYEYLIKTYAQTGKHENEWKDAWITAMDAMQNRLVRKTRGGLTYVSEEQNEELTSEMGHLACFIGGNLIYGARTVPASEVDPKWEKNAAEITETCFQMYHRSPTHVGPEAEHFVPNAGSPNDMEIHVAHSLLRPEVIESIFYMFYYTGDPKYRRMAGEIFEALERYTKTTYGYGGLFDVRQTSYGHVKDEMETFFLAETLKYLYLCFVPNPREVLNLDEFVFNTEAHPIRVVDTKK